MDSTPAHGLQIKKVQDKNNNVLSLLRLTTGWNTLHHFFL